MPHGQAIGPGFQFEQLSLEQDHFLQFVHSVTRLGRHLHHDGLTAPILRYQPMLRELLLDFFGVGIGQINFVYGDNNRNIGGLGMIDGLYGAVNQGSSKPSRWRSPPFDDHWTSSLFVSQDGVAIDSVAVDVCRNEPTLDGQVTGESVDNSRMRKTRNRWAKLLGFKMEAERMEAYEPDGRSSSLYARIL